MAYSKHQETWLYTADYSVVATDPASLTNTATATGTDGDAEPVIDTDSHTLAVDFQPVLELTKTAVATAQVGDLVFYTYVVAHHASSDGSPVGTVSLTDDITGTPTLQSGDTNTNNAIDAGETWTYTDTLLITAGTTDPTVNLATVNAIDIDGDPVTATDSHSLDIDHEPVLLIQQVGATNSKTSATTSPTPSAFRTTQHRTDQTSPVSQSSTTLLG